ncbi:hypothetical protein O3P69_018757 [Scylla paramamosain]|uniref:Uncharacterized protein n=1 Tax=Scylla paramamosain TaxID=85552 RepID=A0AAW0SRK4_SCYPA
MQVEGSVDGNPCRLTVDTGAEKTANLSDEARKVPAGAKLGTCEEVERPEETSGSAEVAAVRQPNRLPG